ncbi:uncharacterized protein LOC123261350 [Cotesia glomerata]|uniref:uncharacterized protein LOC123261350 n=1 Tax=Cotesia glomerata TaxID=32391 RepID=UPI001D02FC7D|nr:uncharacterized protein LOC123261350 [Cotesia glomerata]
MSQQIIEAIRSLVDTVSQSYNDLKSNPVSAEQCDRCFNVCQDTINYFNTILLDPQTSVHVKRSVRTQITLLHWFSEQFLLLSGQVVGGDLNQQNNSIKWQDLGNAFSNNIKTGAVINRTHKNVGEFFTFSENIVCAKVQEMLNKVNSLKINVEFFGKFEIPTTNREEVKSFVTQSREILASTDIADWYKNHVTNALIRKIEEFCQEKSGWRLSEISNLVVTMSKYQPLHAGISTWVRIPQKIINRHAVLNIENFDEYCFLWCVVAAIHPPRTSHRERTTSYPHFSEVLKYDGINFPIQIRDIAKFEKMNNLSINVYGLESDFSSEKSDKKSDECVIIPVYLKNCIDWFVGKLKNFAIEVDSYLKNPIPMKPLTKQQLEEHKQANICYICEKKIINSQDKCYDHNHFTGYYRGPAHLSCKIDLLPINKDRYISFTKHVEKTCVNLRFIDSFKFMASSLDKLASNLKEDDKKITKLHYNDLEKFRLVIRKGVFPYEYITSIDKLNDTKLPERKHFYSKLSNSNVTKKNYAFAQLIWKEFNIKTLGEYSDLYLKTDVLLLADIFENFRSNCLKTYRLDPLHYYTVPGLAFDAMLKYTGVELELLTDSEMMLFIEKGVRGGVSQCTNRYALANNRYMGDNFDSNKPESYLMYFDVNNLYGASMSMPLPTGSFEWVELNFDITQEINKFLNNTEGFGYILEVDLKYPEELYDLHKDLPLCPEHFLPPDSKHTKLATTLYDKKEYVIHYRNLKQCLDLGLKLTKVHRILKFRESPWLKPYKDKNTDCRKAAKNEFEKDFYKLMNNAVFDTDSLIYHFTVPNIYEIIKRDIAKFDTSDYPPDNIYNIPLVNKKVLGLMKDENNGKIMSEFVGLRAKLYAFQIYKSKEDQIQMYESDEEVKDDTVKMRAKGVKKSTLRTITFDDYKQCLFDNIKVKKDEYVIKSRNHEVNTLLQTKLALSWEDDKRQLLINSTDTLPWGL